MNPVTFTTIPALLLLEFSRTATAMLFTGLFLLLIAVWAARNDLAQAHGLDKVVALSNLCFAIPLAAFGAEHLSAANFIKDGVPPYIPWHLFWAYFVGFALIAASLSIAAKIEVRWSGLLFGLMIFSFVAMLHLPRVHANMRDRISWAVAIRDMSFAGGGWILAGTAMGGLRGKGRSLITIGRVLVAIAAIFFAVEHFRHPLGLPGVPLEKQIPTWVPARAVIDYLTGIFLLLGGVCFLLAKKTRVAAAWVGGWILLMVVIIYGPMLVGALMDPGAGVQVEGLNYFFDTLLFAGTILALANAMPHTE